MKKFALIVLLPFLISFKPHPSGEITSPAKGKAVVYFVRTTIFGMLESFSYFDRDKYIGRFAGPNFIRYECEPGEHLFMCRSHYVDFIQANLEADKIYFIEAVVVSGGVRLKPVDVTKDPKRFARVEKQVNKKDGVTPTPEEIAKENERLKSVIEEALKEYDEKLAKGRRIERLEKDMFYEKK